MNEHKPGKYHFFVDNNKFDTDQSSMSVADIKTLASVPPNYGLFLEARGNDPDRQLSDGDVMDLANPPKHFYAVPPATFGRQ